MQMLTKFESKSSRAKGVAFHPKRPWILVSLHSSTIQLWDYRMGTLIDRFEDHDGPVRGVDFHKTQPLFVSGGDDYNIKVWSLQTRKCLFTLTGHLDYIRTVFFHEELPWIISASDDQTIRIWNWQNRQEIACLTGHNHYIMCAQFHPKEDLVVSASLDQTVRVWDIAGLRKKHSAPSMNAYSFEDQLARANSVNAASNGQPDIFGNTDAVVKYVLEGHDRGVNWASFHPTLPLIVSGGDDRVLKVWRMSETKAWELDTCRGHLNNILCCLFHPYQDMIISVGEDKTIRTWDLNKRTPIHQFKRESDRFWNIAAHNSLNLFAACHDSGVMVFKLERERPASAVYQNSLFFINNENQVKYFDASTEKASLPLLSLKKIAPAWEPFRDMSYNPAERCILLTTKSESGNNYQLVQLPKDVSGAIEPTGVVKGAGDQAIFVARNRFVVFTKSEQTLDIKDLANSTTKTIKTPFAIRDIAYGGPGLILLLSSSSVALYDVQQKKLLGTVAAAGVKYVVWSTDNQYLALLSKHAITIANKSLELVSSLHETIRIKSAAWDDTGVLLYSTLNHMKFSLLNGDTGIIKTLDNTVYLSKVKGNKVFCLARGGKVEAITIDPTEYRFKRALVNKNFQEVLRIITNSNLVGQSIISYLQQKGYPEVALQFVQNAEIKFELALECGNLPVALEQAKTIDKKPYWTRLATEALSQGNLEIVELVYQKQHHFDKLSFLYLISGNQDKLAKMSQIAQHRGDYASWVQNSIYANDVQSRILALRETGMSALAYTAAQSYGLTDIAQEILDECGLTADQINIPAVDDRAPTSSPHVTVETFKSNWPLRSAALSFFEQAIVGQLENTSLDDAKPNLYTNTTDAAVATNNNADAFFEDELEDEEAAGAGGWGFDDEDLGIDDLDIDTHDSNTQEAGDSHPTGSLMSAVSEVDLWIRNSPVAADHVAAGSFETAAQLLNRQVGVVNLAPLKVRMFQVYKASKAYLPTAEGFSSLPVFIRRTVEETDGSLLLPLVPGYESLSGKLQLAYKKIWANEPEAAIDLFREIIHTILVLAVSSQEDADECLRLIDICKEYILAFSIELERRKLGPEETKRNLELAAYFTRMNLQPAHMAIPYHVAMIQSFKNKNFSSASYFATKLLDLGAGTGSRAEQARTEQARKIKAKSDSAPLDAIDIDFDPFTEFDVCPASFTPIYPGESFDKDPLTGAKYHSKFKGKFCKITTVTMVGAPASGLRLYI
ncbi:alpha subunit of COPI vesicle coatomer complex [Nadsonia fulvescens var. elongata DSM 6958]|uniref:Coatomer subunit alpha n=1 Tax=Nadsonia fulvescens var. elongata DSM 6958 TaxID=857566 RepID=A0A1E3PNG1_9ASCO|nr:alpha subunit of COPI vesicle coatomer complex [Nadsonia fulvescens var. elongata DSM 6958]